MPIAHFNSFSTLLGQERDSLEYQDGLVKNALILIEGRHTDRNGRTIDFTADDIQEITDNTNSILAKGQEVPFIFDHAKQLYLNGEIKKLGEVLPHLESRVVEEKDLPKPEMTDLLGKMAVFGKVRVVSRLDDVRKGLIRLLSPGIDLANRRLFELSAVLFPAIVGPALFSLDYVEAKQQMDASRKLQEQSQDCLSILFSVLRSIDSANDVDATMLRHKAFTDFVSDLGQLLGITGLEVMPIISYSKEQPQSVAELQLKSRKKKSS
ncbi:hypothetical protein [Brasilonema sp. UFV-L1]|uniref:hypothetical protein n=1 Tax=Brasilonema sp. UFV-L1 TaxID=2234130 RepID=UPI00145C47D9|nr:hypothetical protein [Brasilonema sp. UFV-L1]NMG10711.1 hypothetical protein [Brasilonema sp. UFV-L1]